MKSVLLSLVVALAAVTVNASILTTTPGKNDIAGVNVAKEATLNVNNQALPLELIGAGLRSKKVLFANVKVYVAELFSSDAAKFVRTESDALTSLDSSRTIAMQLNFVRTVDADKVQTSFRESFEANKIDMNEPSIAAFLKAAKAGGEAVDGKALLIASTKNADGTETIYYETTSGQVTTVAATAGTTKKIMSIWLGRSADDNLVKLKADLISGNGK